MKKNQSLNNKIKSGLSDAEKRSEEVSDIIERMPIGWTRLITVIISVIIVVMIILGLVIKYPDTVVGNITITGEKAPIRMVASAYGRLHLLVGNNVIVKKGTCIGYIENGSVYQDVLRLDSICKTTIKTNTQLVLPEDLELGALSPYYNDFVLAYNQYDQIRKTNVYENMRKTVKIQQQSNKMVAENLKKEIELNKIALKNLQRQYKTDSILNKIGAISEEDLSIQYKNILNSQQTIIELGSSKLVKQSDYNSMDVELAKVDVKVREELSTSFDMLCAKYNILINQIRLWKEQFLFIAPISGELQYLGFWRNDVFVEATKEIFSISPTKNQMIGELLIPSSGAGKVVIGQDVNVKLSDYPYDEYGYVRGKVKAISTLTRNIESTEGGYKAYLVTISFPDGLKTNFGKQLRLNYESIGIGEIITEHRRLIQRLFDNIKAKETK